MADTVKSRLFSGIKICWSAFSYVYYNNFRVCHTFLKIAILKGILPKCRGLFEMRKFETVTRKFQCATKKNKN